MLQALLIAQAIALLVLLRRLAAGRTRRPPAEPLDDRAAEHLGGAVSVLVPTLDEARRIGRCLDGLARQGAVVREVLVVDSGSRDGTQDLVRDAGARDPRVRLTRDPPLPPGWVGKMWALQHGLAETDGEWVLGVDADVEPRAGAVAGALAAALAADLEIVSFSPSFAAQSAAEQWIQPAILVTLVYRTGPVGARRTDPDRVMANGQFFLARRAVLERHGGFAPARGSFADDVTLARHHARAGARVGFLDGSRLYVVRSYESAGEMWREWGRSVDLRDATRAVRQVGDLMLLAFAQALPWLVLPMLIVARLTRGGLPEPHAVTAALIGVNSTLVAIRLLLLAALRGSYATRRWTFWLSPLADPLAVLRIVLSTVRRPRSWRGRDYRGGARLAAGERVAG